MLIHSEAKQIRNIADKLKIIAHVLMCDINAYNNSLGQRVAHHKLTEKDFNKLEYYRKIVWHSEHEMRILKQQLDEIFENLPLEDPLY